MSPDHAGERAAKDALTTDFGVSRETLKRLEAYVALLTQWQETTNLVAPSTIGQIWSRHILDSAQLFALAPNARTWIDLGSGGGLPGLVLACQLKEVGGSIDLVESNTRKAAFLRHVATQLALPAQVHGDRIEAVLPRLATPDIVTARALAPLAKLIGHSKQLLKSGAIGLFPKGREYAAELTDAGKHWHFSHELHASRTEPEARIIRITGLT
ncbi:MAG: 16S rRNA (guanine(527)-N(7))-methyltransferase RsmG [Methylobacterium sp.]|nr:16S rRNA (guanine(527)-N(7))-methyltransferase RsmG [Methylobacterium sp.]MCA3600874.1 16S rRNA (guanine(527)-N(7))-methyltransferase RsmG [Methylobacterium sp.]MCA3605411.1 16S rRNA (guanine(527)-N(7))-methyltransferase RsmG [Methylobacterium sp.]MCA3608164.1 16S rRNA (guanine(527)-N(7))-methyltransferase RsmG [Methylobacterium sp.]MCA3616888.1 16S rRNA (guanine(527)-N(7))-methyltransferase RsmG [Methylobacterium sp.]